MNIVVVQTAFLGDVLLSLPLCALLRQTLHAHVTLVTTPQAAAMVDGLDCVDAVRVLDKRGRHRSLAESSRLGAEIGHGADIVVVPHASWRTALFVRAMRSPRVVTFATCATRWFATDVVDAPVGMHDADRQLQLMGPLVAGPAPGKERACPILLHTATDVPVFVPAGGYAVLAPGSVWATKQWPREYVHALAQDLARNHVHVVAVGDTSTKGWVGNHEYITDLCGDTSLRQAAAVIAGADIVVANDSAPLHMASLQGVPTVALFGPTIPEYGFGPFGENTVVMQRRELRCRPCSPHGLQGCPLGTHACMRAQPPADVRTAVTALLEKTKDGRDEKTTPR